MLPQAKTTMSYINESTPNQFIDMYSEIALPSANPFLQHEKHIVASVLKENPSIKNLVVVGSGPAAYLELAEQYHCNYIGIDPFYRLEEANQTTIFYFDCSFSSIKREQLPEGECFFLFWFNVLHYIKQPTKVLQKITNPNDIILHSTWSCAQDATPYMQNYFKEVYRNTTLCYQEAIERIRRQNSQFRLENQFKKIKNSVSIDNHINRCNIIYL